MKIKGLLLAVLLLFMSMLQSHAAFHIKSTPSIAAEYETQKTNLQQYVPMCARSYGTERHKCMVSKVGRGMMVGGGTMLAGGILWGSVTPKRGGNTYVPDGAWTLLFFGFLAIVLGDFTAIVGGIYNATVKTNRYSWIAPKYNQLGVAYNF